MMDWASELAKIKEEAKRKRDAAAASGGDGHKKKYIRRAEMESVGEQPSGGGGSGAVAATDQPSRGGEGGGSSAAVVPAAPKADAAGDGRAGEEGGGAKKEMNLPESEIIRRLRVRSEPIKLFGEELIDTFRRLRRLELEAPLDAVRERQTNEFMEARLAVNEEMVNQELGAAPVRKSKERKYDWTDVCEKVNTDAGKGDPHRDQKLLRQFCKCILQMWGDDLDARTIEDKRTPEGTRASTIYRQTEKYIAPLLKHFKQRNTPRELVPLLVEIAQFVTQREYQKANDAYIRMSIGNAAWPTGVTNVGIHSRPGREKISEQNIAHILNDENSRKYIQSLKRLMTYCQTKFPTTSSKSFEYKAMDDQHVYPVRAAAAGTSSS